MTAAASGQKAALHPQQHPQLTLYTTVLVPAAAAEAAVENAQEGGLTAIVGEAIVGLRKRALWRYASS